MHKKLTQFILFAVLFAGKMQLHAQSDWVVIGDKGNADSEAVWEHLKSTYELSDDQLLEFDFPDGDELSRTVWEDQLRPEIAKLLAAHDSDQRFKRIITLRGTPLAVGPWEDERETKEWLDFYQAALDEHTRQYNQSLQDLAKAVGLEYEPLDSSVDLDGFRKKFDGLATEAQSAIADLTDAKKNEALGRLQATVQQIAGVGPFVASLQRDVQAGKTQASQQLQYLRGRTEALSGVALLLERVPASYDREAFAISLLQQTGGQIAVIGWLQQQLKMVADNDSAASLDSELACVLWKDYRRLGTVPNFAHPSFKDSPLLNQYPTFEVARLDGPSVDIAKALVDRAKAAESSKLEGNVYLDLRGIEQGENQTVRFERWLRSIGQQMESVSGLKVKLENTPQLFGEGECPDTLLYCGWYSLGRSIDSFTFKPGAVAYHLVPEDAAGIHDVSDQGWCKYFLEKGATRVIGSVGEVQPVDFQVDGGKLKFHAPVLSSGMVVFGL